LNQDRIVEPSLFPDDLGLLRGGRFAHRRTVGIARGKIKEQIDDEGGAEQHRQQDDQTLEHIFPHGRTLNPLLE